MCLEHGLSAAGPVSDMLQPSCSENSRAPVWLPAMTRLESPATVMLRMATPTSGTSSQLQELAVRSHTLMLPCWSPVQTHPRIMAACRQAPFNQL